MHAWTCCCVDVYGANGVYDVYFVLIPFAYSLLIVNISDLAFLPSRFY